MPQHRRSQPLHRLSGKQIREKLGRNPYALEESVRKFLAMRADTLPKRGTLEEGMPKGVSIRISPTRTFGSNVGKEITITHTSKEGVRSAVYNENGQCLA